MHQLMGRDKIESKSVSKTKINRKLRQTGTNLIEAEFSRYAGLESARKKHVLSERSALQ